MSYTGTFQSNIGYNAEVTYSGIGPYVDRVAIPAALTERLKRPNAKLIYLVTVLARVHLKSAYFGTDGAVTYWFVDTSVYGVGPPGFADLLRAMASRFLGIRLNNASQTLLEVPDYTTMIATPGSWLRNLFPGIIVIHPPANRSFFADEYSLDVEFTFSNFPKTFRDFTWMPRVRQAPNLSLRIEPKFGGVAQTGGGTLKLINNDGFFDGLEDVQWDAGTVTIEVGVDVPGPGGEQSQADYRNLGTWRIDKHDCDNTDFTLSLREIKTNLEQNIPRDTFTREAYPAIGQSDIGQPIPMAYGQIFGAKPILLDRGLKRFKIANHPIKSFLDVRLKKTIEATEINTVTTWESFAPPVFRYAIGSAGSVKTVLFNTTELTETNSTVAVAAAVATWTELAGYLYVNPPAGQTITSGTWTVTIVRQFDGWVQSSLLTTNRTLAEFTLGADWNGEEVSVDFLGRTQPDGQLMDNAADIVADLLDYIGETALDNESFSASRAWLTIGVDTYGNNVNFLQMSLYIDSVKTARDVLSTINETIGSYLFIDFDGVWRYHAFKPLMGETADKLVGNPLKFFTEKEMVSGSWRKSVDAANLFSKVHVRYAKRLQDGWDESVEYERPQNANAHNLNRYQVEDREVLLARREDAQYYAQRALTTEAEPLTRYSFTIPWLAFFLLPGDQIHVQNSQRGYIKYLGLFDLILEVYEVNYDLINGQVRVVAGNRRAWNDTFGFWALETMAMVDMPAPKCWLDANQLALSNNQKVSNWPDRSGFNNPAAETTVAFQPVFRTNVINGLPAVKFGFVTNQFSGLVFYGGLVGFTAAEVFVLLKLDVTIPPNDARGGLWEMTPTPNNPAFVPDASGVIHDHFGSTGNPGGGPPGMAMNVPRIYNVTSKSGGWTSRLDTTVLATTATNTFAFPDFPLLGGYRFGAGTNLFGHIAEFILYDRELTAPERAAVVKYLSDKYALGLTAPAATIPSWDIAWTIPQKTLARQNHGYWQGDPSEMADEQDGLSVQVGRWW